MELMKENNAENKIPKRLNRNAQTKVERKEKHGVWGGVGVVGGEEEMI